MYILQVSPPPRGGERKSRIWGRKVRLISRTFEREFCLYHFSLTCSPFFNGYMIYILNIGHLHIKSCFFHCSKSKLGKKIHIFPLSPLTFLPSSRFRSIWGRKLKFPSLPCLSWGRKSKVFFPIREGN